VEELILDNLINKQLINEKRIGNIYKYTLTNDGSNVVKDMLKNPFWRVISKMIILGYSDKLINIFINKYGDKYDKI